MNQCTAIAKLHPPEDVANQIPPGHSAHSGHILCELGEGHDDDHAQMLWDDADNAVWVRWNNRKATLTQVPWCPVLDSRGDACGMFADHPAGHSWDVTDPTWEALRAVLAVATRWEDD
ncbi:hypothetical protein ACIP4W_15395 [Streptomyces sp. NPDC088846]|uniref:hypothetical protein n=1 Tax=Streptomyces sp. NPDC088846 TaxID=3365908 RepID=UPI0037F81647